MSVNFYGKLRTLSLIIIGLLFSTIVLSQPLTGIYTVDPAGSGASNFTTLKEAIDSLNSRGVGATGVTFNVASGFTETAPAGGYVITASGTQSDHITFNGNAAVLTASASLTAGTLNDAILKIIGGDYITLSGFVLNENVANTTTAAATNNMTEWGIAILNASTTNGSKHVTLQNNTIVLNRTYQNTFGIYASSQHAAATPTTSADITSVAGAIDTLHIYGNTISNVNIGIAVIGSTTAANMAKGLDIGGSSAMTGNTISDYGTTGTFSSYASVNGAVNGIYVNNNLGYNVGYNTITSSVGGTTAGILRGIYTHASGTLPTTGSYTNTISHNSISVKSATTEMFGILNALGNATVTLIIDNNDINNTTHTGTASSAITLISNTAAAQNLTIASNTFTNLSVNTTGSVTFIANNVTRPANASCVVVGNSIVTGFAKTGAGGTVTLYNSNSSTPATGTEVNSGNNFSNITLTGATTFAGWVCGDGSTTAPFGPTKTITGNTFSNITGGTSAVTVMNIAYGNATTGGSLVAGNTISSITNGNAITGITSAGGVQHFQSNTISGLTNTTGNAVTGIVISGGVTQSASRNKIYNLETTHASGTVYGLTVSSGTAVNIYNNVIGDLRAPIGTGSADIIRGINITSTASLSAINVYFNSIYLNASSSGANFSTAGVFHTISSTATTATLNLRNNIIVNTSTPSGTGVSSAYRRSAAALTNYGAASNNNLFYAGTPSAYNVLYYDGTNSDQTISAFQTRVGTARETASISEAPDWVSTVGSSNDYLKIGSATITGIESGAVNIASAALTITGDFDGNVRAGNAGYPAQINGGGTSPDMGAWEFDGLPANPGISNIVMTPGIQCTPTAHTITATIAPNQGTIVTATLNYAYDGVAQTPITMTNTTGNTWSGVIPASGPGLVTVTYSITAVNSVSPTAVTANGTPYADDPFFGVVTNVTSSAGQTVCLGSSTTLTAAVMPPSIAPLGTGTVKNTQGSTGAAGYPAPFGNYYQGALNQMLITAAELSALGFKSGTNITAVAFDVTTVNTAALSNFTISMRHTTVGALTSTLLTGMTEVYYNASYVPSSSTGFANNKINFNTPFIWDGTSNVVIQTCFANTGYQDNAVFNQTTTSFVSTAVYRADLTTVCSSPGSATFTYSQRPNMILTGSVPAASYTWSDGTTTVGTGATLTVTPTVTTTYTVTADEGHGCTSVSAPFTLNVSNASLNGTYTVGVGGDYPTLTAAVDAYNVVCNLTGPVVFDLIDTLYSSAETFPIIIKGRAGTSSTNTLTIKPATGVTSRIVGSDPAAVIRLHGADFVTIDGSNNGTSTRDLTIRNTNAGTSSGVVWVSSVAGPLDSANNNTIKNTIVSGNSPTTTFVGIVSSSGGAIGGIAEAGNCNNSYINNQIISSYYGVALVGANSSDLNTLVKHNEIGSADPAKALGFTGIFAAQQQGFSITENEVVGITSAATGTATNAIVAGINMLGSSTNGSITANKIANVKNTSTSGYTAYGIQLAATGTAANISVYNNFISEISSYGSTTLGRNSHGIYLAAGGGYKIYYNSISMGASSTATGSISAPITVTSALVTAASVDIRNNILSNTQTVGNRYAIYSAAANTVYSNVDYNGYWSTGTNLAYFASADRVDMSALQGAFAGANMNSKTVTAPFTSATDLHIPAATLTHLESGGVAIAGITTDIDGNTRPGPAGSINGGAFAPDLGAHEFDGTPDLGDIIAPVMVIDSIRPILSTCLNVPHTVYATVTDASGIDSALIFYKVGSQPMVTVMMNLVSGDQYVGDIPVFLDSTITYSFRAVDASVNKNRTNVAGGSYKDFSVTIDAGADVDVLVGQTATLSAKTNSSGAILFTDIVQYKSGSSEVYPSWIPTADNDYIEISNIDNVPHDLSGYKVEVFGTGAGVFTIPAGTILGGGQVMVLAYTGTNVDAVNNFYGMNLSTTTSSGNQMGFTLKDASGAIVDVVATNGYTFPSSSGVTAADWSGSIPSNSGIAGSYRKTEDTNKASDWFNSTTASNVTVGVFNPGLNRIASPSIVWTGGVLTGPVTGQTITTPAHPSAGVFSYTATLTSGSCTVTDVVDVTVLTPQVPVPMFSISNNTPYVGGLVSTVDFTDHSTNIPDQWKWSFSPNTVTFVGGTSSTSQNPKVQFSAPGLYSIKLVVSNVAGADSLTKVDSVDAIIGYCLSGATSSTTSEDIGNVTVSTGTTVLLDNGVAIPTFTNTTSNGTYTDYTNILPPFDIQFGLTYTVSVAQISTSASGSTAGRAVYIDLNHNGSFDDAGEKVFTTTSYAAVATPSTGTFTIPMNTPTGLTRMRVVLNNGNSAPPSCGTFSNGETEDYAVNIVTPIGDFYPPNFTTSAVLTPAGGACFTTDHTVEIGIFDTTGVDSAWVIWSVNGVVQPDLLMINTVGTTYSAVIPSTPAGSTVAYSFKAKDSSPNQNVSTATGGVFADAVFNVKATTDQDSIGVGGTVQLAVIAPTMGAAIGSGNITNSDTGYPAPYGNYYLGAKHQMLFRASELIAAGLSAGPITGMTFDVASNNGSDPLMDYTVKIASTTRTSVSSFQTTGFQTVFSAATYQPVNGINTHMFSTPYMWDGTSNIIVETCHNNDDYFANASFKQSTTSFRSTVWYRADVLTVCGSTSLTDSATQRPNVAFLYPQSITYTWTETTGGGIASTNSQNTSATPTGGIGTYTYTISANNGTCTYVDSVKVKVINLAKPIAKFGVDRTLGMANTSVFTFTDSSANLPSAWTWVFNPASTTFVNGTTANSKNPQVTFDVAGTYAVELRASNTVGSDTLIKTGYITALPSFCASNATSTAEQDIGRVQVGSFTNGVATPVDYNPTGNKTYTDFTALQGMSAPKVIPQTVSVSVISGTYFYGTIVNAFIDYNHNGVFDLPQERVLKGRAASASSPVVSGAFTPPITALTGPTLMRFVAVETSNSNDTVPACGTYTYGETEDYIINILPPPPGDYYAPDFVSAHTVTPAGGACVAVPHTIEINVTDTTGVDSVWIVWTSNGVLQPQIPMTHVSGSLYSGDIPANSNLKVDFSFIARDSSPNKNVATKAGGSYRDEYFAVSAGPDKYIGINQTATLSGGSGPGTLLITDLVQYKGGSSEPYPSWVPTADNDFVEISNVGSLPIDASGYTLTVYGSPAGTFTIPNGTILGVGKVMVLAYSGSAVDVVNNYYGMNLGGTTSSGVQMGFVLKSPSGTIVDAVATNGYTFTVASGVTSADWSGSIASNSGIAGSTRIGADNNTAAGWVNSNVTNVSIGVYNVSIPQVPPTGAITWTGGLFTSPQTGNSVTTPVHPALGNYSYIATGSDGTCTATDTVVVHVVAAPTVDLGGGTSKTGDICGTAPRILDAGNPGATYLWSTGATTKTISVTVAGKYKVTVTNQAGLSTSDSITLTAAPAYTFSLGADRTLCPGGTITLDAGTHIGYLWSTGETTQTIQVTATGKYSVTVTNGGGCTVTDTVEVTPTTAPTLDLGPDATICSSSPKTLDAGFPGSTYLWSTGATSQTIDAGLSGTYWVVVNTTSGCMVTDTIVITNSPAPSVDLGADQAICAGANTTLDAGNAGMTFLWSTGATTQTITVNAAGTYFVKVTNPAGCSTNDTVVVTEKAVPVVNLGPDRDICTSDTITLDAGNPGMTYLWSTGATTQTIRVSNAATYSVTVTNSVGCSSTDLLIVTNKPEPNATFTIGTIDRGNVSFTSVSQGGHSYSWNFGDNQTTTVANPTHTYQTNGTYTVTLTVTNLNTGCKSTTTQNVTITTVGVGRVDASVFSLQALPNPFVGNTQLKYFLADEGKTVTLEVYDMLGRKISTIAENEIQSAGDHVYDFNSSNIKNTSGVYMVRLIVDNQIANMRVIDIASK